MKDIRDPSLHIRKSELIKVWEELDDKGVYNEEFIDKLFIKAKSKSCPSRSVYASNNKLEQKVEKLKLATRSNAGLFAQSILLIRRKLKHKGITLIKPADPEWLTVKEATNLATQFCNEFLIDRKIGYREYVEIGLSMMTHFNIGRFKSLHQSICNRYEAIQEIRSDRWPDLTRNAHSTFLAIISEKTGFSESYEKNPDKYRFFVQVSRTCREIGITVQDWIKAQFAAFEWKNAVPEPSQLAGEKARERVMKYCFENDISLKHKKLEQPKINFKQIKAHGKKSKGKDNTKQPKE
jgi:hypothetical protein